MAGPNAAQWARIYAKAWLDEAFKNKLQTNPKAALAEAAQELGVQQWDHVFELPPPPPELGKDQLQKLVSGESVGFVEAPKCC
jgi:hypothetical protein